MTIRKTRKGWKVLSHSGKSFGVYSSWAKAVKRLRQIEWFKNKKEVENDLEKNKNN